jgi:tight adherence protein C
MEWWGGVFALVLAVSMACFAFLATPRAQGSPLFRLIPPLAVSTLVSLCLIPPTLILLAALGAAGLVIISRVVPVVRSRRERDLVRRELPTLIDSLVLKVESGQSLVPSFLESREILDAGKPLHRAVERLRSEIRLGTGQGEALKNLREALPGPDFEGFIDTLLQATELGTPIGRVLREQSLRMRERLLLEGERFANTLPLRLLGPLFLFIFPAAFLLILAPVIVAVVGDRPW